MIEGGMRAYRDKALRLTGAPPPGMRRRAYFDDGGAAGESGNAGAAGAGEAGPMVIPAPVQQPMASASDLKTLDDKVSSLGAGTPYTSKKPIDGPKLPGTMRRGGRSRSSK